jgi:hypothetical protein
MRRMRGVQYPASPCFPPWATDARSCEFNNSAHERALLATCRCEMR